MNDVINLVFWRQSYVNNYGDELSPFVVGHLTGKRIQQKDNYQKTTIAKIKQLVRAALTFKIESFKKILFPWQDNLLAIGSVLAVGNKHSKIWGSGFICDNRQCTGGEIYAVRGKYSDSLLRNGKWMGPKTYGDPALLLPMFVKASENKHDRTGIIPHYTEYEYFKEKYSGMYEVINLNSSDVESVTKIITSCKRILSTSLHGVIVSHAYGIPALWIEKKPLETVGIEGFKFRDYFSAVGVEEYLGIKNYDQYLYSEEGVDKLFTENARYILPNNDLSEVRAALIKAFPLDIVYK